MSSDKLLQTFMNDSRTFIERLNGLFLRLEKEPESSDLLEQAFRWAHSLKSEASYMDFDGLSQTAHSMETILEDLRRGEKRIDSSLLDTLFDHLDQCQRQMALLDGEGEESSLQDLPLDAAKPSMAGGSWNLSDFEVSLLEEAKQRGDQFYRMVCELDDDTPMKYAKAYLIINNLELIVNVVKIIPSVEELKKEDFNQFSILFSSSVGEGEIYNAVNVDQVKRIHLNMLRYGNFESPLDKMKSESGLQAAAVSGDGNAAGRKAGQMPSESSAGGSGPLKISPSKMDQLMGYMDEMRLRLHQFENNIHNPDAASRDQDEWERMRGLMEGMEGALRDMRHIPLSESLGSLPRQVRDLCRRAGKQGRLEMSGGEIRADKRIAELLAQPLSHLIRNAVDHGLETAEKRESLGKEPEGLIRLDISQDESDLVIRLSDDGAGIVREEVEAAAAAKGLQVEEGRDLLRYLMQPGFSTRNEASALSGRGLGLDLIARTIRQEAGGTLSMETRPGAGTTFIMRIPRGYRPMGLLLFKFAGEIFCLPKRDVSRVCEVPGESLVQDPEGGMRWEGLPVYTPHGRFFRSSESPAGGTAIILSHLGQEACILADEILFEQDVAEDQMRLGEEIRPYIREVYISSDKKEYFYLDPSLIV